MANNPKLTDLAANASADAVTPLLNTGYLRIYSGTQPATADTAITSQTLLAELRFASTAFGAAADGVATANAIVDEDSALATGTATWFRLFKSDGTTAVADGSVGTSGADLNLSSVSLAPGITVSVTSFTYTQEQG